MLARPLRVDAVIAGAVAPWLIVSAFTGGIVALIGMTGLLLAALGAGALLLLPSRLDARLHFVLAAPVGFLVLCGIIAFSSNFGGSAERTLLAAAVCALFGLFSVVRAFRTVARDRLPYGAAIVAVSVAICVVYFLPGALRDAVVLRDGSCQWIYPDTQFFHAIAVSAAGDGPPHHPGLAPAVLNYHFGPYAVAGALGRLIRLDIGTAFVRSLHPVGLMVLVAATGGLGHQLARRCGGGVPEVLGAVVGLFFVGSLTALFSQTRDTATAIVGTVVVGLPKVPAEANAASHLLMGHSTQWGVIGLLTTLALVLEDDRLHPHRVPLAMLVLPALTCASNGIAALGLAGTVMVTLIVREPRRVRAWGEAATVGALFVVGYWAMRFHRAPGTFALDRDFTQNWGTFWLWVTLGLGLRLYAFRWFAERRDRDVATMVTVSFVGFSSLTFFFREDFSGGDFYGISFAQSILGVFGTVALVADLRRARSELLTHGAASVSVATGRVAVAISILFLAIDLIRHSFRASTLVVLGSALALIVVGRWLRARSDVRSLRPVVFAFLGLQSLAWIPPVLFFGLDRMQTAVVSSPAECAALRRVRDLSLASDRIATNHQEIDSLYARKERSYYYTAVLERRVLVEGSAYANKFHPEYAQARQDNDRLFSTTDPEEARRIVDTHHVGWIVLRPSSTLRLVPIPSWLKRHDEITGLEVFEVQR